MIRPVAIGLLVALTAVIAVACVGPESTVQIPLVTATQSPTLPDESKASTPVSVAPSEIASSPLVQIPVVTATQSPIIVAVVKASTPVPVAPSAIASPPLVPTPTSSPVVSTTKTAAPATPAAIQKAHTSDRSAARPTVPESAVWAGNHIPEPGQTDYAPPWLTMRVRPGDDPDEDQWHLESGPSIGILPPATRCSPNRQEDGWLLSSCIGMPYDLTAFMPMDGDAGLEVSISGMGVTFSGVLSKIAPATEPQKTDNVTVLWHQPGGGLHTDIWAEGDLVFAPREDGVVEILAADTGAIVGETKVWGEVYDVKSKDGLMFASTQEVGLQVFDVSDPSDPTFVGEFRAPPGYDFKQKYPHVPEDYTNFHNIFVSPDGRYVYAMNNTDYPLSEMIVIDVSQPRFPTEVGSFSVSIDPDNFNHEVAHDVNVIEEGDGLVAYLNYQTAGLWILDVTDPASIATMGSISWDDIFSHSGWPFTLGDRRYYAHNSEGPDRHMTVLDVTDPANPEVVSRFASRDGISIHNVQVEGGVAYISYYLDGLRVVDLREPAKPREIGHFDTVPDVNELDILQGAWGVRVLGGRVYISDRESGIFAFQVDIEGP